VDPEELAIWLASLVETGDLTSPQAEDVLEQRQRFDERRPLFEREMRGRMVGFAGGEIFVADTTVTLLDEVIEQFGGERLAYFEAIDEETAL